MSAGRVFLVAAEPSGDALGADLVRALKARAPGLAFAGVGGRAMAEAGVASAFDISDLAVLGLIDGVKAYPRVVRRADEAAEAAKRFDPDVAVLIDSWGFTLRVAQRLRAATPRARLVKYVGPQVWATRPGRAKTLAAAVDHLVCIHDFEAPIYAPFGLPVTVAGHPAVGRATAGDGAGFRARHGLSADDKVLIVLPGSRRSELRRVGPTIVAAAARLVREIPGLKPVLVAAETVEAGARALAADIPGVLVVRGDERNDAFAAGTAALAASGTVTTEVGLQGTPVVVGYKLGWITWALARAFLLKSRYVTLMNVAAASEVAPEFIQTRFTVENLVRATAPLLTDPAARARQVEAQNGALVNMGRGARPAAEIAADVVLAEIARVSGAPALS
ncbi:MAG: lipid-A-disaccharide synthase [Alphaproteobacteria bacterium]|nr:lipid-A-disaccharide synthase [Alphaproteobacteria bacterium]